jgi:multidrug resistance efflux pump
MKGRTMTDSAICTCCKLHGQGTHRPGLTTTPDADYSTPELDRANKALATAVQREDRARDAAAKASRAAAAYEATLHGRYENTMAGIEAATSAERRELARLREAAKDALAALQEAGLRVVEARELARRAQHLATQQLLNSWKGIDE